MHTDQTEHFLWQRGETVKDGIALHCLLELHFCHHPSAALITERTTNATPRLKFHQQPLIIHRSLSCVFFFLFKFSLHFWQQFLGTCNCSTEIRVSIIMTEGEKRKKSFVMYSLLLERCSYPHNNSVTPSTAAAVKYSVQATAAQKCQDITQEQGLLCKNRRSRRRAKKKNISSPHKLNQHKLFIHCLFIELWRWEKRIPNIPAKYHCGFGRSLVGPWSY